MQYTFNPEDSMIHVLMPSGYLFEKLKYTGNKLIRYLVIPNQNGALLEDDLPYHEVK